jgi:hypothetical protein
VKIQLRIRIEKDFLANHENRCLKVYRRNYRPIMHRDAYNSSACAVLGDGGFIHLYILST